MIGRVGFDGLNAIFVYGFVVDLSMSSRDGKLECICTLRIPGRGKSRWFMHPVVKVYGYKSVAETMTLVCQPGNALYCECKFGSMSDDGETPRVIARKVECLSRKIKPPTEEMLSVLDASDPIGYLDKGRERRKRKRKGEGR